MPVFAILLLALTAFFTLCNPAVARENHAILIGASTYPNLDKRYWLKGPANDIDLVARYLSEQSAVPFPTDNITILADGLLDYPAPTLAAIRQAFRDLAPKLQEGDFVYLHFSGHGSQAPALDPETELDGLDELFLPVDIGKWNDKTGVVENALVDDEIGEMIASLRATGATVWAVFDSCHSGTATRGAPTGSDDVRLRKLAPEMLGISEKMLTQSTSTSRGLPAIRARAESPIPQANEGGFIAFFAAQTNETTPEKRMPKGEDGRRSQGVFTFVLFETIAQNPGITYRQLGQEVLRRYSIRNLARATPMFEGDLDNIVFSGEKAEPISQWPVEVSDGVINLPAGTLHNLTIGSELLLFKAASDTSEKALGMFRIVSSEAFSSQAVAVLAKGLTKVDLADIPNGAYLRKAAQSIDYSLTVARPALSGMAELDDKLNEALSKMQDTGDLGARIRFVPSGEPADIRLAILPNSPRPDAVWMLPATGFLEANTDNQTPSISISDKSVDQLRQMLTENFTHMAQAINLLKIGAGFGATDLDVEVDLRTRNKTDRNLKKLDPITVPKLIPGDEVHIFARNNTDQPIDINVLYIGSDFSISHFYSGRMQPGDTLKKGLLRITDQIFGRDRLVLVLSPAKPQSIVEDLSFLAQSELEMTRGSGQSSLSAAFAEAGFGSTTRGAIALDDGEGGPTGQILQFEIDTIPAAN